MDLFSSLWKYSLQRVNWERGRPPSLCQRLWSEAETGPCLTQVEFLLGRGGEVALVCLLGLFLFLLSWFWPPVFFVSWRALFNELSTFLATSSSWDTESKPISPCFLLWSSSLDTCYFFKVSLLPVRTTTWLCLVFPSVATMTWQVALPTVIPSPRYEFNSKQQH